MPGASKPLKELIHGLAVPTRMMPRRWKMSGGLKTVSLDSDRYSTSEFDGTKFCHPWILVSLASHSIPL